MADTPAPLWLQIALEEYKALRAEVLTTMQTQVSTLTLGTAALGVIVAGGFNVWSEEARVATILFLFALPLACMLVLTMWIGEVTRMMRAGQYVLQLENRLHEGVRGLPKDVMNWEHSLREDEGRSWKTHYEWNYIAILVMYWFVAAAAIVVGAHRATHGGLALSDRAIVSVAAGEITLSLIGLAILFSALGIVCEARGRFLRAFVWLGSFRRRRKEAAPERHVPA